MSKRGLCWLLVHDGIRSVVGWGMHRGAGLGALVYHGDRAILEMHYGGGAVYLDHLAKYVNTSAAVSRLLDLSYPNSCCGD